MSATEIEINTRETHYFKITAENSWGGIVEQCEEKARGTDLEGAMVRVDVHGELESEFRRGELEEIFKGKPLVLNISDETLSEEKRSGGEIERRARESAIGTLEAALKAKGIRENEIDEAIHGSGIDIEEALEGSGEKGSGVSTISGKPLLELLDFGILSDEDFQGLKQALMALLAEGEQKIIDKSDLDDHIDKGWRYVESVDEGRAIVEKQLHHRL
ncbi:hypothetical protein AKJ41_03515 [candidate division MSBL1 archaeon SCGC-AAA259O05]|uniref:Uncharacterized protein n=2 Tax=candidate division MSBL1 TaxID=215777 RepID=A0A133V3B8_9EURY|nr:hypothetical protein AKJ64_01830 [candidate division MSBL1 archaeon SCGC-AAA259E17]KXB00906.1 hypothetical protein AKJ41_03515 [candidate division MSBL1 archaeon SCGC-AAA259O05]